MDQEEFDRKYVNLRVLKSIQEYTKSEGASSAAVYPIRVPEDLLYQVLKLQGPENVDKLIHHIFRLGLDIWSEEFFTEAFGSQKSLEQFIDTVRKRHKGNDE